MVTSADAMNTREHIRQAAREGEELRITAAKVVEGYVPKPWPRAVFFAIRQGLMDEWQPKGGMDKVLIDTLAASLYMCRLWLRQHINRATTRTEIQKDDLNRCGKRRAAFSWELKDTGHAARIAVRFHRMAMRTRRALRDLRRCVPPISIRSSQKVNIAERQVSLAQREV